MVSNQIQCKCGCYLSISSMYIHLKSKKHKKLLELREDNDDLLNRLLHLKKSIIKLNLDDKISMQFVSKD
jgi:hypothetical protein